MTGVTLHSHVRCSERKEHERVAGGGGIQEVVEEGARDELDPILPKLRH